MKELIEKLKGMITKIEKTMTDTAVESNAPTTTDKYYPSLTLGEDKFPLLKDKKINDAFKCTIELELKGISTDDNKINHYSFDIKGIDLGEKK